MKQNNHAVRRIFTICLTVLLVLSLLTGCKSRAVPASKEAVRPVGTVDGKDITYEELYFLAASYSEALKVRYGEGTEEYRAALDRMVRENIVTNPAILRLCEDMGLSYDEKELSDEVQSYVDNLIDTEFGGKRSAYLDNLQQNGLTDHYLRYTTGVDTLYGRLSTLYIQNRIFPENEAAYRAYIKENFIRTWHIAIFNDPGESKEDNYRKAQEALEKLENGSADMYKLIGSTYNEDLMLTTTNGYYFAKGTMDEDYEAAAFALEINGISPIVEARGENNNGQSVDCYYIIQRLELEDSYIDSHFDELTQKCQNAILYNRLSDMKSSLHFEPNDYYNSLDLTNLSAPAKGVDVPLILMWVGIVVAVGAAAVVTVLLIRRRKKKKAKA